MPISSVERKKTELLCIAVYSPQNKCLMSIIVIIPDIIESSGGYGERAKYVTEDIATLANQDDSLAFAPSEIVNNMLDEVAIAVQKGNAVAVRRSLETSMAQKWRRVRPSLSAAHLQQVSVTSSAATVPLSLV